MKEIKLTQGCVAFVDDEDYEKVNQYKWQASKKRNENTIYARGLIRVNGETQKVSMHRYIMNLTSKDKLQIDHINHSGLDNRKSNLRLCTNQQNGMNRRPDRNVSSKYKGVSRAKRDKVWQVQITCKGKQYYLGRFNSGIKAAQAYNEAAIKYHGEFAKLNSLKN